MHKRGIILNIFVILSIFIITSCQPIDKSGEAASITKTNGVYYLLTQIALNPSQYKIVPTSSDSFIKTASKNLAYKTKISLSTKEALLTDTKIIFITDYTDKPGTDLEADLAKSVLYLKPGDQNSLTNSLNTLLNYRSYPTKLNTNCVNINGNVFSSCKYEQIPTQTIAGNINVNFIDPTPSHNLTIKSDYATINVSVNKEVSSCVLGLAYKGSMSQGLGIPIHNCNELQNIENNLTKNYYLVNNIDCTNFDYGDGKGFKPIGDFGNQFNGMFDGQGYIVKGLRIFDRAGDVGLFGYFNGEIKNVGLENVNINGGYNAGGLVGSLGGGIIQNSYTTGFISGDMNVGGLIGYTQQDNPIINNSYSRADISCKKADCTAGGILGMAASGLVSVINSYSIGNITSFVQARAIGGLVGYSEGYTSNSYTTGQVKTNPDLVANLAGGLIGDRADGGVTNSYWIDYPNDNIVSCYMYYNYDGGNPKKYGDDGCTSKPNLDYFYNKNNQPMQSWDFTNIWGTKNNLIDYPTLKWNEITYYTMNVNNNGANTYAYYTIDGLINGTYDYFVSCEDGSERSTTETRRMLVRISSNPGTSKISFVSPPTPLTGSTGSNLFVFTNVFGNISDYTYYLYNRQGLVTKNKYMLQEVGVSTGYHHSCALKSNGNIECWGSNIYGESSSYTKGDAIGVSTGSSYTCALKSNGNIECWGSLLFNYTKGDAVAVSAGATHSCALKSNGNIECWGSNADNRALNYTKGDAVAVSCGGLHTCALKSNGNVECWGYNGQGEANNYTGGDAIGISTGDKYSMALKSDGTLVCIGGNNYENQCRHPSEVGQILSFSAGYGHVLALRPDHTVACWGANYYNQCNMPAGLTDIIGVFAGDYHSCALKSNGNVICWGLNNADQARGYNYEDTQKTGAYSFNGFCFDTYYFNATACYQGNCENTETRTFNCNIFDTIPPFFSDNQTNATSITPKQGDTLQIGLTINDNIGLSHYILAHNLSGVMMNTTPKAITSTVHQMVENLLITAPKGMLAWMVWANDTSGNSNTSEIYYTEIKPQWSCSLYGMLGSGTLADPCVITSCTQLQNMIYNLNASYALNNDIDCYETKALNSGRGFSPVGNSTSIFRGNFNGRNNKIYNLVINGGLSSYCGLFGYSTGNINNIGLVDVNINCSTFVGAISGKHAGGTISNSYSTGNLSGGFIGTHAKVGGLVGEIDGVISNSYSKADIIIPTTNLPYFVGGLVGLQSSGTISNSYYTGNVSSACFGAGGIAGYSYGIIENSYSTGFVNGFSSVGGLVGAQRATIKNSYSTANVVGSQFVGGFVGHKDGGAINNSYSSGKVVCGSWCGGFVGWQVTGQDFQIFNSYYDTNIAGYSDTGRGDPKTTDQMNDLSTFINGGWNISLILTDLNNGYPYLAWQATSDRYVWLIKEQNILPKPIVNLRSMDGSNTTNSDLNCSALITDPEGGKMNLSIRGYKNGELAIDYVLNNSYPNGTMFSFNFDRSYLAINDVWYCSMALYNGRKFSNWSDSNTVKIISNNQTPIILYARLTTTDIRRNDTNQDLKCYANIRSDDNNSLIYFGEWHRNGEIFVNPHSTSIFGGAGSESGSRIALDSAGNLYGTGTTTSFGSGGNDVLTIKYDNNLNILWNKTFGGAGSESGNSVALDNSGNIYLVGNIRYPDNNNYDILILKYNNDGILLWNKTFESSIGSVGYGVTDYGNGITVDNSGNFYVVGSTANTIYTNALIAKFDTNGNPLWNKTLSTVINGVTTSGELKSITSDRSGNLYVIGSSSIYFWIIKLDQYGNKIWDQVRWYKNFNFGRDISVDNSGNVYVVGYFKSFASQNAEFWTIKDDSNGNRVWSVFAGGPNWDTANGIFSDNAGNVYVTGSSNSFTGNDDFWTIKYDNNGIQIWNKTFGGAGADYANDIVVHESGDIYIAGSTTSYGVGDSDLIVVKYKDGFISNQQPGERLVSTIDSSFTETGDKWMCSVRGFNGTHYSYWMNSNIVEIINYTNLAPDNPTINLKSLNDSNTTNFDLNCSSLVTDPENNALNVSVEWYRNNMLINSTNYNNNYPSQTIFNSILSKSYLREDDVLYCRIRLFDGNSYSDWSNSNTIKILKPPFSGNRPPNNPIVNLRSVDGSNTTNSDLNCSALITDPESNKLNVTVNGYKNGTLFRTLYFNNSYNSGTMFSVKIAKSFLAKGDVWYCSMRLFDGKNYSNWSSSNSVRIIEQQNGDGTLKNPYKIRNCEQLQNMMYYPTSYYAILNNIDCSETLTWNGGKGFQPFYFRGSLDGYGHSISNLYARDNVPTLCPSGGPGGFGLFCRTDGNIKNLSLINFDIESQRGTDSDNYGVGALVGAQFSGLIENVYVYGGRIKGATWVGGLVGISAGTIQNIYVANVNIAASDLVKGYAGGIAGSMGIPNGLRYLKNSYAVGGNLSGGKGIGGLIGRDKAPGPTTGSATIINSYWNNSASKCINPYPNKQIAPGSCSPVRNTSVFYNINHHVYTGTPTWDFTRVWVARANNYPGLRG